MTVILAREDSKKLLGDTQARVEIVNDRSYYNVLFERLESEIPIVALYKGAYREASLIYKVVKERGLNPYLLAFVDSELLNKIPNKIRNPYLQALANGLEEGKPWKAYFKYTTRRKTTRRSLLLAPLKTMKEYLDAPILVNPQACINMRKCYLCHNICDIKAINGKPPEIDFLSCTQCMKCVETCPFEALSPPGYPRIRARLLAEVAAKHMTDKIVLLVSASNASILLERITKSPYREPPLVDIYPGPHLILESILLSIAENGAIPAVLREDLEGLNINARMLIEKGIVLIYGMQITGIKKTGFIKTHSRLKAKVSIDPSKCTFCGACTVNCPTSSLSILEDDWENRLVFDPSKCNGCGFCMEVCPEEALSVEYGVFLGDSEPRVLVASDTAFCRVCGAPIGSVRTLKRLEMLLRRSGAPGRVIDSIWLCSNCRKTLVYGRLDESA